MKGFQVDIEITQIKELKQPSHQPHMIASTKTQNIYELLQCQQPLPRLTQTLGSTPQRTHGLRIRAKQPHLKEVRSVLG
jgi:CHAD domain-containing protein